MSNALLSQIYGNVVSTLIALIVLSIIYFAINAFTTRKMASLRAKKRFQIRLFYVVCVIFLFILARIWVEGFTHLLAVLGLVSAALVVTNKETIMNIVGWLIIMWRGLFTEDDLIQIQEYKGYVKNIGVLYFTLSEVQKGTREAITGRVVRIPNGLVANNPLINFSQTAHLIVQELSFVITNKSDIYQTIEITKTCVAKVLTSTYNKKKEYTMEYLKKHSRQIADRIKLEPIITIQPKLDKPSGTEVKISFYCFSKDALTIQQTIWLALLAAFKSHSGIDLAYDL